MKNNQNRNRLVIALFGAALGIGAVWLLRRRKAQPAQVGAKNVLLFAVSRRMLAERRDPARAETLLEAVRRKYAQLCLERPQPTNRALRMHLYENILPGLALYQVLLAEYGGDQQAALAEIDEIFRAWTLEQVSSRFGAIMDLPIPFRVFKLAVGQMMNAYPPAGWEIAPIENSGDRMAFNITRCFYLDTLKALNATELTASFCATDDVMAERFPGTVRFVRQHTLGRGDGLCDFQYCRACPAAPRTVQRLAPNQGLYHYFAPLYDRLFDATYAGARRRAVELLGLQPGEKLLISGVGTGLDLPQIAAGVQASAVDISVEMLREAAKKRSPASVELMQMDAQCLDFPANSFDAALLNLIVSVAPNGRAVFQEAWRTLKPGGRLVLFDKFLPEGQSVSLPRAVLGGLFRWIGTDINRRLSDIVGSVEDGVIEMDESSLFFGQYRILRIKKCALEPQEKIAA